MWPRNQLLFAIPLKTLKRQSKKALFFSLICRCWPLLTESYLEMPHAMGTSLVSKCQFTPWTILGVELYDCHSQWQIIQLLICCSWVALENLLKNDSRLKVNKNSRCGSRLYCFKWGWKHRGNGCYVMIKYCRKGVSILGFSKASWQINIRCRQKCGALKVKLSLKLMNS